ncbi:hypothetical protein E3A20_09520 [Planctomyces bekefii]|uniref:Uncharacterized protein n=1 Tax=Planctomyces bekefii TaxID=1653850 RepID=A0A5C6M6S2_9PLAN|nr:hypothetical protein E3A20_09520 [Planctomyces bekefii]
MTAEDPKLFEQIYRSFYNVPESQVIANKEKIKRFSQVSNRNESGLAVVSANNLPRAGALFKESERFYRLESSKISKNPYVKQEVKETMNSSPGKSRIDQYRIARARALQNHYIRHCSYPINKNTSELVKLFFPFNDQNKKFEPRKKFLQTSRNSLIF